MGSITMAAMFRSAESCFYSVFKAENDTKAFLTRMFLLAVAAILLVGHRKNGTRTQEDDGRMCSTSSSLLMDQLDAATQYFIVPLYAVLAFLYLTAVAFRQDLRSFLEKRHRRSWSLEDFGGTPRRSDQLPPKGDERQLVGVGVDDWLVHDDKSQQPVDLTGVYRLVSNDNFEAFLAAQGVPWALRSAANRARPIHRITHRGRVLTIKIEGIIESQTTYLIDGPPVETNVRGRIFEDVVNYLDGARRGIIVRKKALTEDYDVTVQRELSEDGAVITMTSTATFRDSRPFVQSKQIFHRVIE